MVLREHFDRVLGMSPAGYRRSLLVAAWLNSMTATRMSAAAVTKMCPALTHRARPRHVLTA